MRRPACPARAQGTPVARCEATAMPGPKTALYMRMNPAISGRFLISTVIRLVLPPVPVPGSGSRILTIGTTATTISRAMRMKKRHVGMKLEKISPGTDSASTTQNANATSRTMSPMRWVSGMRLGDGAASHGKAGSNAVRSRAWTWPAATPR